MGRALTMNDARWFVAIMSLSIAFCASAARARADEEETHTRERTEDSPARLIEQPARNLFSLERLEAALEISGEYEQRYVRTPGARPTFPGLIPRYGGTRQRNTRWTFDEQLALDFAADVVDPSVLSLSGSLGLGLTQERFRETYLGRTDRDSNEGYLSTYDLRADFLRGRPLSGSVYGLRSQDRYSRPFLPSLREERNEYGAALYWTDDRLPMELTFDHREVDRMGRRRQHDGERLTEDLLRYQATWITSPEHSMRLSYEFSKTEERYSGSRYQFDNTRHQFRIDDELLFGEQNEHRLDTVIRVQDEHGDYARDLVELGSRMSLRHSERLTTNYQYQFSRQEIGQIQIDTHRGDWQLIHQLYNNLTTTLNLYGMKERVEDDTETDTLGAIADVSYNRRNPLGVFSANLSLTGESERTRGSGNRAVVAESAAFRDPLPVVLSRPNVLRWSIVVRDARRLRFYVPHVDYFITTVRDRTLLIRNPLGAIGINETVFVDYFYRPDRGGGVDTTRVDFRMQQDFDNGLTPYYHFEFRHEDRNFSSGQFVGFFPLTQRYYDRTQDYESNRHRAGLRYRRDRLTAGGELEVLRDNIEPFTAYRLYSNFALLRQPGRTIDARVDWSHYFFDSAGRGDTTVLELTLDGRVNLTRFVEAYLTGTFRHENDGTRGRGLVRGIDVEGGLSWAWNYFTLTASVEYDQLRIVGSQEEGLTVWLKVRRDFGDLRSGLR
jgi:hypothetical protein